ncbi:MAG TPA: hypothetical protein VHE83_04395 [Mycobacteriales bacterium]|nr:hypothetical protein [Mycobacteriales bacterium]
MDIRANRGALLALGIGVTLVPGFAVFLVLRAVGVGVGPAGLLGLLLIFVGCFAFSGWAWSGVGRAPSPAQPATRQEDDD